MAAFYGISEASTVEKQTWTNAVRDYNRPITCICLRPGCMHSWTQIYITDRNHTNALSAQQAVARGRHVRISAHFYNTECMKYIQIL